MSNISISQENDSLEFCQDSQIIGDELERFLRIVYPSYLVDKSSIDSYIEDKSSDWLEGMKFFRITSCTAENIENLYTFISEQFEKLLTALHCIKVPIAYGIISRNGVTNLVIGIYSKNHVDNVVSIMEGMLSGLELKSYRPNFASENTAHNSYGVLTGIPSLYVKEKKQKFSLAPIMRSLNGQNYTLLFIAKAVNKDIISQNISDLISIRDQAFSVSKRNIGRSTGSSSNTSITEGNSKSKASMLGVVGGVLGGGLGSLIGIGGLGAFIGQSIGQSIGGNSSESYSKTISDTITKNDTISRDIQNGFAIELMNYANHAIERLKAGQNNGIWQTAITYSSDNENAKNIIQSCLSGELSKSDEEKLPMIAFEPKGLFESLAIPKFITDDYQNPLCSYINSSELGMLCTVPTESVPDFELRIEKSLPLVADRNESEGIQIGHVVDGKRSIVNMPFSLSEQDLNKHTFICGITGSGKTTTVKKILVEAKKPFLVIESAKKEYRNIAVKTTVYTPGKPDINAPLINPFYIMPGIHPQVHIDYLKDLFNASFSFYGPMPYILEKCLQRVYEKKGWDLTFGYHPLLNKTESQIDFFNISHIADKYSNIAHKFLFPTMQELKDEIARYVEEELQYDGEVAGNVKTAMKVRLENLCSGTKGYTFNTNEPLDVENLLNTNTIFELEGLADDSDKAFAVGLLLIFINEYRNVQKELSGSQPAGLQHLLVIEEAHRLLKNVSTERTSEIVGNPQGKAVEHFTNMIAEMRAYGQGVIVAEQIPTKLAPEVIKNSSTKIVQRIVSSDDQQVIANTIGMNDESIIQLGALESGYAYCHKEGMALPTPVRILNTFEANSQLKLLDEYVSDELLYNINTDRFDDINYSIIKSHLGGRKIIKERCLAFINTLMTEGEQCCIASCKNLEDLVDCQLKMDNIRLVLPHGEAHLYAKFLSETILSLMVSGVYSAKVLPNNEFTDLLKSTLYTASDEKIKELKKYLQNLYSRELVYFAKRIVENLIRRSLKKNTDIPNTIRQYFIEVSDDTVFDIEELVKGGSGVI